MAKATTTTMHGYTSCFIVVSATSPIVPSGPPRSTDFSQAAGIAAIA